MHGIHKLFFCTLLALAPGLRAFAGEAAPVQQDEASLLLLEVRLGPHVLAEAVPAFQHRDDILLPLGELSRLLTIAVRTSPADGRASGYVVAEHRRFALDVAAGEAVIAGRREALDRSHVLLQADDIYIASKLLARWLPVDLDIDLPTLAVRARAREQLPVQARLERRRRPAPGLRRAGEEADPGFPRQPLPYRLADVPFIDQTLGFAVSNAGGKRQADASYSAYVTGDLLGVQASLFATRASNVPSGHARVTLGRNDPDAGLLGPLHARTVLAGSVPVPGLSNISLSSPTGNGFTVSNRHLHQPSRFDRHSLQGDLPPGWDVELYYNDALVGYQQSRADGKYSFEDQPLAYGPNEFRLVFHGPLGQLRVERHSFLLEQSAVAPGALYYGVTGHRDAAGRTRAMAQFEWGMSSHLSATAALVRLPLSGADRRYAHLGLHAYLQSSILGAELAHADGGGRLAQVSLKTRLGGLALSAAHARADGFTSEVFQPSADPVRTRDELRIDGAVTPGGMALPLSLQVRRDGLASGARHLQLQGRISAYRYGTAVSHALRWQSLAGRRQADGVLQASRRVAGLVINGQLEYGIAPRADVNTVALSADRYLPRGYVASLGLARSFADPHYRLSAALNKNLGRFGLGLHGYYTSRREYGAGIQLFMALGFDPRARRLVTDAQPMAGTGAASLRVFLDRNLNGMMDEGDEPVRDAGFTVNGNGHATVTDAGGLAYLRRLPAHRHLDIGLDQPSLEDPQWHPQVRGVRIVPRPGKVAQVDFALSVTGEIDGSTYLLENGKRRPMGDLQLELLDRDGKLVATIKSAADGYYVLSTVFPGTYLLRVAPGQLVRLGLHGTGTHPIVIGADGTILNGRDFTVVAGAR